MYNPGYFLTDNHRLMKIIHSLSCYPEIQGGAPVFEGTRIRFETFVDYMRIGVSVNEFLSEFPSITLDQAKEAKQLFDAKIGPEQVMSLVQGKQFARFENMAFRGQNA